MSQGYEWEREPGEEAEPEPGAEIDVARLVHDLAELLADPMKRVDTLNDLAGVLPAGCLSLDAEPPAGGAAAEAAAIAKSVRSRGVEALKQLQEAVVRIVTIWGGGGSSELHTPGTLPEAKHVTCRLWFGTNRRPGASRLDGIATFTDVDDQTLHWGSCTVVMPDYRRVGSLGSAWYRRMLGRFDDRPAVQNTTRQSGARILAELRTALEFLDSGERTAIVFIHGYNVTFEKAARVAAQIGSDLYVPGVMAFYSWPSRGKAKEYPADEATIDACEPYLTEFLSRVVTESGATRVHIIAHSMGNRGLARAIQRIASRSGKASGRPFANLILAAPDIDQRVFLNLASTYTKVAQRTTLYASSTDLALRSSGVFHDHPRAGYTPPVTVVKGVDTIEVSGVDLSWLGHGYFAAARPVLQDMHALLSRDEPPTKRYGLARKKVSDQQSGLARKRLYWVIRK